MSSTKLVKSKDVLGREELADLLELLATRVREGQLTFELGAEEVAIALPEAMRVDVEVSDKTKPKRRSRKLEIELKWEIDEAGEPVETPAPDATLT